MRKYVVITLSMLPTFKKDLDKLAKKLGVTRSILIRKAVHDYLKTKPKKSDFSKEF